VYDGYVLVATSELAIGEARMRSTLLIERAVRGTVILREGLAFDTKFAARAAGRAEPCGHVFLLLDGRLGHDGGVHEAPVAFVMAADEIERVGGKSRTFRTDGPRATVIQLRVEKKALRWPIGLAHGPIAVASWDAARALAAEPTEPRRLAALLAALAIPIEIELEEPERFRRLWAAIEPLYAEYGATMSIKQIANALGMSMRQVGRDAKELASTFGLGDGYRDALLVLRLRTAVLMLSAEGGTVAEVARLVGYGSPIAMARAFRDAKLPAPSDVQNRLRHPDDLGGSAAADR
jgi:AraC-like DNA-binding protein